MTDWRSPNDIRRIVPASGNPSAIISDGNQIYFVGVVPRDDGDFLANRPYFSPMELWTERAPLKQLMAPSL